MLLSLSFLVQRALLFVCPVEKAFANAKKLFLCGLKPRLRAFHHKYVPFGEHWPSNEPKVWAVFCL
jgi:hypothetical protein